MFKSLILFIFTILILFCFNVKKTSADASYLSFQEIYLEEGKMLEEYTDEDYDYCYKKIGKRQIFGWKTYTYFKSIKVKYVSKTIFSYFNRGTSAIDYTYSLAETETEKLSLSGTGSINYTSSGTKKGFKNGLGASLKIENEYSKTVSSTTKEDLEITVNPGTVANLRIVGEGKLTNGVATQYVFWFKAIEGGFEYFIVTTEYPRLEVMPI